MLSNLAVPHVAAYGPACSLCKLGSAISTKYKPEREQRYYRFVDNVWPARIQIGENVK